MTWQILCLQFEDDRRKPTIGVKKYPVSVCVVLAVSIALIVACTVMQKHGPGVSIHETYVEIYPGTKISSGDQKALDAVLKNFDKSLYKIMTYDRGKLVKTEGSLDLIAEVSKASQKGVTESTQQIVKMGNPDQTKANVWLSHCPPPPQASILPRLSAKEYRDSKRLVSRVTPILQKYSHDQIANVAKSGGQ